MYERILAVMVAGSIEARVLAASPALQLLPGGYQPDYNGATLLEILKKMRDRPNKMHDKLESLLNSIELLYNVVAAAHLSAPRKPIGNDPARRD